MWNKFPAMSSQAVQALRSVNLLHDAGSYDDGETVTHFVRCAGLLKWPRLGLDVNKLEAIAAHIREVTGDAPKAVMVSSHPDYGDYLRVARGSATFNFICNLQS